MPVNSISNGVGAILVPPNNKNETTRPSAAASAAFGMSIRTQPIIFVPSIVTIPADDHAAPTVANAARLTATPADAFAPVNE